MLSLGVAVLIAATAASQPEAGSAAVAQTMPRYAFAHVVPDELGNVVEQALPPPPGKVERKTRYFGTVTIDHRLHLAQRAACASCHGPGPVSTITFTPKLAHDRCIGCHRTVERGPTSCRDCHVKEEPPAPVSPGAQPKVASALFRPTEPAAGGASLGGSPGATPAISTAAILEVGPDVASLRALRLSYELGFAAGTAFGPSVRMISRIDDVLLTYSVARLARGSTARVLALMGGGLTRAPRPGFSFEAEGVGGFAARERPRIDVSPAIGLRLGVAWRRPSPLDHLKLSTTALTYPSRHMAFDDSSLAVFTTVSIGFGGARP